MVELVIQFGNLRNILHTITTRIAVHYQVARLVTHPTFPMQTSISLQGRFHVYFCQWRLIQCRQKFGGVQIKAEAPGTGFDNRNDRIRD